MAAKDCPYCEGKNDYSFIVANTDIRVTCEYCDKGVIPKLTEQPGLFTRIANFFGNGDAPTNT